MDSQQLQDYAPPAWASGLSVIPTARLRLALLPTPLQPWRPALIPPSVGLLVKRDDLTGGMELAGNKIRKMEFLIAEAKLRGHDSVITIGGAQGNGCRPTAVAARLAGLDCHAIVRVADDALNDDPGLAGNWLPLRLVGAHVHLVSKAQYAELGSVVLCEQLLQQLQAQGLNPMIIPIGGSSPLGVWGYLHCAQELAEQHEQQPFTDVVLACSGAGTTVGLALGNHLGKFGWRIWAYIISDDEEYMYDYMQGFADDLGASKAAIGVSLRDMITIRQAKGSGFGKTRREELELVQQVATETGIVLDPEYTVKAFLRWAMDVQQDPQAWEGRSVVFIHTGGQVSLYNKLKQLQPIIEGLGRVRPLQVSTEAIRAASSDLGIRTPQGL